MEQRIIKFRGWHIFGKKMVYNLSDLWANDYKVMQFTGLKDKNGKEIYEGDIVSWFADGIDKKAIVKWMFNGYVAERIDKKLNQFERFFKFQSFIPVNKDKFDGKIIGNIYENPELLKKMEVKNNEL